MKKALPALIVAIIVIAGLAYYFANKNSSTPHTNTSTNSTSSQMANMPSQTQSNTSSAPEATDKVTISNFAFSPANITVKKGTTVTWTNQDSTDHTVTESDGQSGPKSDNLGQGQSYSFTYDTAGTFQYHCSIHPDMTGTVTVTE